jgi:dipeptidyl aminopeptidase/acylaminoacyl peptidase
MITAPYGSWRSPITSDFVVGKVVGLSDIQLDGDQTYWAELRPQEAGRTVVIRRSPDGTTTDLIPPPFNARTRVHEYGGGSYVASRGQVFFSNFADQKIYQVQAEAAPRAITAEGLRYADMVLDQAHGRNRLIAVQEDHRASSAQPVNSIVAVPIDGSSVTPLVSGGDFYASPRLSPDGTRLAWLTWNHPNMPWDGTELWVAGVARDGSLTSPQRVAGGPTESIFQPEWSPSGVLHFVSDRTGWWNLYRLSDADAHPLLPMQAEFGMPLWVFGLSCYAFVSEQQIACAFNENGFWSLGLLNNGLLNTTAQKLQKLPFEGRDFQYVRAAADRIVVRAGAPDKPAAIVQIDLPSQKTTVLKESAPAPDASIQPYLSFAERFDFPVEGGGLAHAFLYRPCNSEFTPPASGLPPLLVRCHGGPTSAATSTLGFAIQYWTSRGYTVLDVNYGGSTGYGRPYRDRLKSQWGLVDVSDSAQAAQAAVKQGLADPRKLLITGGSAGGYTVLCALAFTKVFSGGASHFGVSDPAALARDTHKFESCYLDSLIAPYPQQAEIYDQRSPFRFAAQISAPVIFFQGEDDKVVPVNQTEMMVDALRARGLPVGYLLFQGEGHGFRRGDNIKRALDGELAFYDANVVKAGLRY